MKHAILLASHSNIIRKRKTKYTVEFILSQILKYIYDVKGLNHKSQPVGLQQIGEFRQWSE